ncbi:DUF354 domain-containing protein [Natrialba sp. SSL1]|uniref:DUF354 domain-containing protein n=1 Tax=Natrialba sp. SSL1 TaxID=1869245 RepID=UPI0008F8C3D6|nr:DUF354 domain-containing protein [Natrialba sp. SSL1]OIB56109.1 hypothetical protein BBD46_19675 [Natrialba sp. SSL1]
MTIVFTIQHPAHVHLFRNPIKELEKTDDVEVVVRDKEIIVDLLEAYDIDHTVLADGSGSISSLPLTQLKYEFNVWRHVRKFDPNVIVGVGGLTASHVATLTGATSIVFIDNEDRHAPSNKFVTPLADVICTPQTLENDYGSKQVRYDGFHELAYLHPDEFEPKAEILKKNGIDVDERYFVLRFVGWNAHHDVGRSGFSVEQKSTLVDKLSELGNVYITSESPLPSEFEEYRLPIEPHHIHHLLYFANMYIGDSQTMATEAAMLGTPSIRSNSFASENDMSNFKIFEDRYDLLYSVGDSDKAITRALELANDSDSKSRWRSKSNKLMDDMINVNEFITKQIRRYQ